MSDGTMKPEELEKKLVQAKHRLEEAEMRDKAKERKLRTRRLIERGAILEKAIPNSANMTNDEIQSYLYTHLIHS